MTVRLFGGGNNKNTPVYTGLQIQTSALNLPIAIGWGQNRGSFNLIWWNDFQKHAQSTGKGKGGGKATTFTYSVATLLGLMWGQVSAVPTVYTNQAKTTLANLGFTLFNGTAGQSPFGYITTHHPTEALSYPNIAYLANSALQLGSSPTLPSISLEMVMNLSGTMPGTTDANTGDIIPDLLTNPLYGMGLTSGNIGASVAFYKTYVQAEGLFMSPILTSQEKVSAIIDRWAQLTNSWIFWSGNEIKFVPLGTQSITANAVTYTPVTDIRFHLTDADFLDQKEPVKILRVDPADAYNNVKVEIKNRALDYNSDPMEYKDQTLIDKFGIRETSITASEITTVSAGLRAATLIGKRLAYLRNTYSFRTNHRYIALEPGDLILISSNSIPMLNSLPVRIKTVECDEKGDLTFTAEDYSGTVGNFNDHATEDAVAILFDKLVAPGDVNPPMVFEPDSSLADPPQIWIAASGGANWGGCDIWASINDITYGKIGTIRAPAPQGVLTAPLASHSDPDTVNTLAVDLSSSFEQLSSSVIHDDADKFRTLSYLVPEPVAHVINQIGELISYGDVAPTGTYTDNLTYLRRGLYGTSPASHSTNDQFTSIDLSGTLGSTLKYQLPPQYIGQPIYLKFLSFNLYDLAQQDLSSVTAYQYTTRGTGFGGGTLGVPTTPTGLAVSAGASQNTASWNSNPVTDNVTSYKLYRANGTGASFGSSALIWQGLANNYTDVAVTSGSGYTYFLSAVNMIGEGGHTAGVNATTSTFTKPLRISVGTPGRKPGDAEVLFNIDMKTGDTLPANLAGSLLGIDTNNGGVAPTGSWTITIKKNNTTIFTGTIAGAATTGTYSAGSQVTFVDGDFCSGTCISPQDATAKGISLTLVGTRTQ